MNSAKSHWDELHDHPRFRPVYPVDHVVRFMMQNRTERPAPATFLDIGVGAGRHAKLAADLGFIPFGMDISEAGIRHARSRLLQAGIPPLMAAASMLALPFPAENFDVVLSYGVFYYGTGDQMRQAILETHRVLVPGGRALIVLRTTDDCRFGQGPQLEPDTFRISMSETNEQGTIQHFVTADAIGEYFKRFSEVTFEKSETTFMNRKFLNSDWLVTVAK